MSVSFFPFPPFLGLGPFYWIVMAGRNTYGFCIGFIGYCQSQKSMFVSLHWDIERH